MSRRRVVEVTWSVTAEGHRRPPPKPAAVTVEPASRNRGHGKYTRPMTPAEKAAAAVDRVAAMSPDELARRAERAAEKAASRDRRHAAYVARLADRTAAAALLSPAEKAAAKERRRAEYAAKQAGSQT